MYIKGLEENRRHLELVFETLRKHKLYVRRKKCEFATDTVEYLGCQVKGSQRIAERFRP